MIRANTVQWKAGVAALVPRCSASAKHEMRRKAAMALEEAQARVHVVSGNLRGSGRLEEMDSPLELKIDIVFGGDGVEYAGYEELLHPFLEPAAAEALGSFGEAPDDLEGPFD